MSTLDQAIDTARRHIPITKRIVKPEYWAGYTIVITPDGSHRVYSSSAWKAPTEQPLLPWHAPIGTPVATVDMDGVVTLS